LPKTALLIQYDGSEFHGFQRQKNCSSVQEKLEKAIDTISKESVIISAAGRTDAGVHAMGMIVSFELESSVKAYDKFLLSLNALTPKSISILAAKEMPDNFHARFSCSEREYEYLLYNSKFPQPLWNIRALWVKEKLDIPKINSELKSLIGRHEFDSFTKASSVRDKSTERQITRMEIIESKEIPHFYRLAIRGTGFLHNMVRILVGTILDVSFGKKSLSLKEILYSQNRSLAGKTLPPYALYFNHAYYKDFPEIETLYNMKFLEN